MCSAHAPKPPPPPVIPPPPPAPVVQEQALPVTAPNSPALRKRKGTLASFRSDLTIGSGSSGLNIPQP